MELFERILYFAIGSGVGFILGFIAARLQLIREDLDAVKKEVHEVDEIIKSDRRGEEGLVRYPLLMDIALLIVIVVTVWAAFAAAKLNAELDHTVDCLTQYNTGQARALEGRDQAISDERYAEIALWSLYEELYKDARKNPDPENLEKLQDKLADAIVKYRDNLVVTQKVREKFIYPDPDIIENCKETPDE